MFNVTFAVLISCTIEHILFDVDVIFKCKQMVGIISNITKPIFF